MHERLPIIIASILELGLAPEGRSPARELTSPKSASKSASTESFNRAKTDTERYVRIRVDSRRNSFIVK